MEHENLEILESCERYMLGRAPRILLVIHGDEVSLGTSLSCKSVNWYYLAYHVICPLLLLDDTRLLTIAGE